MPMDMTCNLSCNPSVLPAHCSSPHPQQQLLLQLRMGMPSRISCSPPVLQVHISSLQLQQQPFLLPQAVMMCSSHTSPPVFSGVPFLRMGISTVAYTPLQMPVSLQMGMQVHQQRLHCHQQAHCHIVLSWRTAIHPQMATQPLMVHLLRKRAQRSPHSMACRMDTPAPAASMPRHGS